METQKKEQIEAKKHQIEAGVSELPDDALEQAAGGVPLDNASAGFSRPVNPQPVI